jgi:Holliday junction resolvase RusA-like endonuclease
MVIPFLGQSLGLFMRVPQVICKGVDGNCWLCFHRRMQTVEFEIIGEPASKANSRRWTGKFFIKSEKALNYSKEFLKQCPILDPLMAGDLHVDMTIWYASRRPDLDESLILDLMQERIYLNDRQVRSKYIRWALDKSRPRTLIRVSPLDSSGDAGRD